MIKLFNIMISLTCNCQSGWESVSGACYHTPSLLGVFDSSRPKLLSLPQKLQSEHLGLDQNEPNVSTYSKEKPNSCTLVQYFITI